MRNIASIAILAACIAVVGAAQTSTIQPSGPSPAKETKTFLLQSDGNLKISNVTGAIKVTTWDKDEVALTATFKQGSDDEYPKIEVDSQKNSLVLVVKFPKAKGFFAKLFAGGYDSKATGACEMELTVPRRINSEISTVNGSIALNKIDGSHEVSTVNGSVTFDIASGKIEVSTVNGSIKGTIQKNVGNVEASTVNGGINLTLADPNGTLSASTVNGSVKLNTPGAKNISATKHSVSAKFGDGNAKIDLDTVNGSIVIQ
ncbi:MAG: DUF4097 family beta strand repeat-containing protein [Holophagales bacterium]|jgi:DUF4097 and DUF4098 domain-containing protein YvlB|nr:DUF4097 family beta strand repeat-containing protein [Holophagales bacterium]